MCCYIPKEGAYGISARICGHIQHAGQAATRALDGRSSTVFAGQTLQLAYRAGLRGLDTSVHLGERQAAPERHGWA